MTSKVAPIPKWCLVPLLVPLLAYLIIAYPCLAVGEAYMVGREKFKDWKEKKYVRALRNRKRALTLPLPQTSYSRRKAQRTYDQSQSRFLSRLSCEIRLIIYEYVLAPPGVLHVAAVSRRLRGIRCYEPDPTRPAGDHRCWESVHPRLWISLGLLYTCRQMSVRVYGQN